MAAILVAAFRRGLPACALALMSSPASGRACELPKDVVVTQTTNLRLDGRAAMVAARSLADLNDEKSRLLGLATGCRPLRSEIVDARDIGLAYRDQTATDRFMDPDRVLELTNEIAARQAGGD